MSEDPAEPKRPPIWVSAFSCRDVLRENNDLLTAFRISDGYRATPLVFPNTEPGGPEILIFHPIEFRIIASFSCEVEATFDIAFRGSRPDGIRFPEIARFNGSHVDGGGKGLTFSITSVIPANPPGTYWFEIYVDEELRLKLPVVVLHDTGDSAPRSEIAKNSQVSSVGQ